MNNIAKGLVAGLVATIVLSMLMIAKGMMGLMPELDMIAMLSSMMSAPPIAGWIAHLMIGAAIWGGLFVFFYDKLPGKNGMLKGLLFGGAAWVLMMIAIMPMAGAGLFGMNLGVMAPVMTLMLHLIFGLVLGLVFDKLPGAPAAA